MQDVGHIQSVRQLPFLSCLPAFSIPIFYYIFKAFLLLICIPFIQLIMTVSKLAK